MPPALRLSKCQSSKSKIKSKLSVLDFTKWFLPPIRTLYSEQLNKQQMKKLFTLVVLVAALFSTATAEKVLRGPEANSAVQGAEVVRFKGFSSIPAYIKFRPENRIAISIWQTWVQGKFFKNQSGVSFTLIGTETDKLGMNHYRYRQTKNGVEVEFGIWIVHELNGQVVSMNGELFDTLLSQSAALNEAQALSKAIDYIDADLYKWQIAEEEAHLKYEESNATATYFPKGELSYVNKDASLEKIDLQLSYKFNIYAQKPLSRREIYINAMNGEVVFENNLIHHADSTGSANTGYSGSQTIISDYTSSEFRLRESGRGNGVQTYNMNEGTNYGAATDFTDSDNNWTSTNVDQYATDAHWGAEMTYDFYWNHFGRNSINNAGFTLRSYVHYDQNYGNAFWDGQRMTYGDGSSGTTPFTALDIAGHEITHGLTTFTADLVYSYESGALNESFSDIFGAAVEFDALGLANGDWTMGEDLGFIIRYMDNPGLLGDPDTYLAGDWYTGTGDNGGVHINSGVQNFWYYLLSTGGSGTNDLGNSYNVQSIGLDDASAIAFRNLTVYLTTSSQYNDARFYALESAIDLFGVCSQQLISTGMAWYAVGVGTPYQTTVTADFIAPSTSACAVPKTVIFNNYSSNATSYSWNFGDGGTSTQANPTHTYTTAGNFTVTLQVTSTCGVDTKTETDYINVGPNEPCEVILPENGAAPLQTTCAGTLFDNGGAGANYTDNAQSEVTISPIGAAAVTLDFTIFDVEAGTNASCNYDYLEVYDGPSSSSPLIGKYCNSNLPPSSVTTTSSSMTIRFSADGGVTNAGFQLDWDCVLPTVAPEADFTVNTVESCKGTFNFTDISTNGANTWAWDFGDGNTSAMQNPTHSYTSSGTYNVSLTASNNIGSSSEVKNNYVSYLPPAAPVGDDDDICPGDAATLIASAGGEISWYDSPVGGNLLHVGDTFITPNVNVSTPFYAQSATPNASENVGPVDNTIGGGGNFNANQYLIFDVLNKMELVSVKVYASGTGIREVELRDNNGNSLQIASIDMANGEQVIPLNFEIEPGFDYQLGISGNSAANMFRNNSGPNYPYDIGGVVSITRSSANGDPYGFYYFYYDWEVRDICLSDRSVISASTGVCTGFDEIESTNFSLYPNPSTGEFTIETFNTNDADIIVTTATGQIVHSDVIRSQRTNLNLSLSAGVYFVSIVQNGFTNTKQLITQ
jgi:Zn-dependent metalloprotease